MCQRDAGGNLAMSDVRSLQAESRGEAWAIFLAAMLAYVAWRWSFFIVWDDTASASFNKYSNNGHFALGRFGQIVRDAFGSIQGDGYRPLSAIVRAMGNAYVYSIGVSTQLFIAINGIFCGLSVVLLYFFSGHFLRSRAARILVIFLFFDSLLIVVVA